MSSCDQELCEHWTGEGCACAVFGIEYPDAELIAEERLRARDYEAWADL